MNTITKLISLAIITTLLMSCGFSGITGSKNVVKEERKITESYDAVKVSTGIDLFITQGNSKSVVVEADDNVIKLLITEVENGVLKIYFDKNVRNAKSRKVSITTSSLKSIKTSSGASVESVGTLTGENVILEASSGAEMGISLNYNSIECSSSSGSNINLTGECSKIELNASSGANIEAKELNSKIADTGASSGAGIDISVSEKISANASSGGNITYYGSPSEKNISKSSGGSVNNK